MKILYYLLICLTIGGFTACTEFDEEKTTQIEVEEFPDQESWNAKMYFTKDGKKRAILESGYIAKYSKKNITLLKDGMQVDFFDSEGNHKSRLTSEEGKVFDGKQDMVAIKNVVVKSDNGNHLYCEELHWNNGDQKIISYVPVMITTDNDTLYGDSMISDPDLHNYEVTNAHGSSQKKISLDE
ncbi:MAG: LPS export ABC transporter periplasmic protein LptC [Calditrichia bacterium]|nr:LPS export ABC transporter periplasmic protein LptC [Calditrichia bacterium]